MTDHQIFPHFVCRVAGVPAGGLEEMAAAESMASCRALRELEAELGQLRGPLSEALFEAVGGLEDQELRRDLLWLKRDVHNLRPPDRSALEKVRRLVPGLERYDQLTHSLRQAEARFEACFEAELVRIRRRFQQAVTDKDFRNGVLLASTTLFDEIERYTRAEAEHPAAKVRQVERSLLRYYTRTAVKTSPFSTFCAIVPGRLREDSAPGESGFLGSPREKSSVLRLNKAMYPFLVQALTARPAVRRHLSVELNPTLRRTDRRWFFLTGAGRREVFQHLAPNPVLGLLVDVLKERGRLPLAVLAETLLGDVEAS
ncbi:MAG TPA: lantibiotic dehydratase, partial [Thermoanaerobaculia bacterium]|nr:lantibiotic dehydratase [Thermoanaerobaculia bacterium]